MPTERITKLEVTTDHIKGDVSEIKEMLIAHVQRENNWRDKADKAYAGKWTEGVLITGMVTFIVGVISYILKLF